MATHIADTYKETTNIAQHKYLYGVHTQILTRGQRREQARRERSRAAHSHEIVRAHFMLAAAASNVCVFYAFTMRDARASCIAWSSGSPRAIPIAARRNDKHVCLCVLCSPFWNIICAIPTMHSHFGGIWWKWSSIHSTGWQWWESLTGKTERHLNSIDMVLILLLWRIILDLSFLLKKGWLIYALRSLQKPGKN